MKQPAPVTNYSRLRFHQALVAAGAERMDLVELLGDGRVPRHVRVREHMAWHMHQPDKDNRNLSYPEIAATFGRTSHSTFVLAARRYEKRLENLHPASVK